jgi:hypothetical protein
VAAPQRQRRSSSGLDGDKGNPYLLPTMNRFFLTFLALLTGLAAQVSPAQAARGGAGETQVGAVQNVRGAVRVAQQVAVSVTEESIAYAALLGPAAPFRRIAIVVPSVRIGIDRALQ